MKQVVQRASGGPVRVIDVPRPTIDATQVLVATRHSVVSTGTERAITGLAQSGLLAKARARPDLVRQVVRKARTDGVAATIDTVRARLDVDLPLGYSAAGIAVEVGEAVEHVAVGDLVATGGAGSANHAEYQAVPGLLCATVPDGVASADAAFATVASIALHGLRLAEVEVGSRVVVVGLGLVGQLAVRLAQAAGAVVCGIDVAPDRVARAEAAGALALVESGDATTDAVREWSRRRGGDAVLVTAGRGAAVMQRVPLLCRDRASVVVVGDVALDLDRRPFYERELTLRFSRSYGAGRYERSYEDWGVDYPVGHVRWTEGRNLEAVVDLLAAGELRVDDLVTHRFPIARAADAYELVETGREPFLAIELEYDVGAERPAPSAEAVMLSPPRPTPRPRVGVIGAGAFVSGVLLDAFKQAGFDRFVAIASASGLSARRVGERAGFERAVAGADAVLDDPDVDVVVIATPHDDHAKLAARALRAGKHVFCEKPLAITFDQLDDVEAAWRESGRALFVGFNRRWSEPVALVRDHMAPGAGPLTIGYRVNAGPVAPGHWYHDRRHGGRLVGEVCHFIDTCAAIVAAPASDVTVRGSRSVVPGLDEDLVVSLEYPDRSLASIIYAVSGRPGTDKEHIEVLGRGRHAVIGDFRRVTLDGRRSRLRRQDKGFVRQAEVFRQRVQGGGAEETEWALASMRTTLEAAATLAAPADDGR